MSRQDKKAVKYGKIPKKFGIIEFKPTLPKISKINAITA